MAAIWIPKRLVDYSLINVAAESAQRFADRCETLYENRVYHAAGEILKNRCPIVMLTGPSASGKTTTAHKIAQALTNRGCPSQVVSLDNFYLNKEKYPRLLDGSKDYENVEALDLPCIRACLQKLIRDGECDIPIFDFKTESRMAETQHIARNGGVVIIEGIHALNPIMTQDIPRNHVFKIYAGLREEYSDADGERMMKTGDIRLCRRMTRDVRFRGHSPETTLRLWDRVCAGENEYIRVFKKEADLLVDTAFSYEVCILAGQIAPMAGFLPSDNPLCERLNDLAGRFSRFSQLPLSVVPPDSMLQEFYGESK